MVFSLRRIFQGKRFTLKTHIARVDAGRVTDADDVQVCATCDRNGVTSGHCTGNVDTGPESWVRIPVEVIPGHRNVNSCGNRRPLGDDYVIAGTQSDRTLGGLNVSAGQGAGCRGDCRLQILSGFRFDDQVFRLQHAVAHRQIYVALDGFHLQDIQRTADFLQSDVPVGFGDQATSRRHRGRDPQNILSLIPTCPINLQSVIRLTDCASGRE